VSCLSIMLCLAFFPCLQTVALLSSVLNLSSFGSYCLEVWEGLYVWDGTCHPHCARNAVVFSHLKCDHCLAMSVHTSFVVTAIFPGKPGLARIRMSACVGAKGDRGGSNWSYKYTCKAAITLLLLTNRHPDFHRLHTLRVAQTTVSKC